MTREEEAENLTNEAMHLYLQNQRNNLRFGAIFRRICEIEEGKPLYRWAGYKTLDDWLEDVGVIGRSHAFHLRDLYTDLEKTIPAEVLSQLPLNNAEDLVKLPESKRKDKDTLEAARTMTNRKFREHIERLQPGMHLDSTDRITFKLHATAIPVVERAIKLAMDQGARTRGEALENVCADWLAGQNIPSEIQAEKAEKVN